MKKKIFMLFLSICFLLSFSGCKNEYNAEVYYISEEDLNKSFTDNNKVNLWDDESENKQLPNDITVIIDNEEDYNSVFASPEIDVDFDSEMLIIYTYCSIYGRTININRISKLNDILDIELEITKWKGVPMGDARTPYQRYIAIKLDKLDVSDVNVSVDDSFIVVDYSK